MLLSTIFAVLFYLATAVFVVGLVYRIRLYARTPAPLKIPTTPAPVTQSGVVVRMFKEVLFSKACSNPTNGPGCSAGYFIRHVAGSFAASQVFHRARLVLGQLDPALRHVCRFCNAGRSCSIVGSRFLVERVRYISGPSDHLMLMLLIGIAASGLMMKYVAHTDIISLKHLHLA